MAYRGQFKVTGNDTTFCQHDALQSPLRRGTLGGRWTLGEGGAGVGEGGQCSVCNVSTSLAGRVDGTDAI